MSPRLKVLISAYACEPNKGSEPEVGWQWALQMARFHDVTVLTRTNNRAVIEAGLRALPPGQPVPSFEYHDEATRALRWKKKLGATTAYYILWQKSAHAVVADLVRSRRPDLLHHVTFAGYRYCTAIWGHGVPCIWGPIGGMESIPWRLLPWRYPRAWLIEAIRNANNIVQATPFHILPARANLSTAILVSTPETQRAFTALDVETELMPTIGLHCDEIPVAPRPVPRGPLRLLFVGQIILLKGVDLLLHALQQSGSNAQLTLIGDGTFLASAKVLAARLGLGTQVHFAGRLPREKTLHEYRGHDVFIFPSLHDSGGFAVLEAMANELPVICLDCGGPAMSVNGSCGFRVPLRTRGQVISDLAVAISFYDGHREEVLAHGAAARTRVRENYDWDRKGEAMNAVYQRAMEPRVSRRRALHFRGVGLSLIVLFLIGALGFLTLRELKKSAFQIVNDTLPGLSAAGSANSTLDQGFNRTLLFILSEDPEERRRYRDEIRDFAQETTNYLQSYQQSIYEPDDRQNFGRWIDRRRTYNAIREKLFVLIEANQREEALHLYRKTLLPAFAEYKSAGEAILKYNIEQGETRGRKIIRLSILTQVVVAMLAVVLFVAGFVIGFFK